MFIKLLRAKGITPAQAARDLNVGAKTIYNYDNGDSAPSIGKAAEIADYLEMTMDELWAILRTTQKG